MDEGEAQWRFAEGITSLSPPQINVLGFVVLPSGDILAPWSYIPVGMDKAGKENPLSHHSGLPWAYQPILKKTQWQAKMQAVWVCQTNPSEHLSASATPGKCWQHVAPGFSLQEFPTTKTR